MKGDAFLTRIPGVKVLWILIELCENYPPKRSNKFVEIKFISLAV